MDVMEVQPAQKGKRGRKRHSDDECLTEAERVKKEKNRQAAQKCREKKEKEAKDLKVRNEELERENKKLSDDKKKLEKRAQEFHRIIQDHIQKGCKLPPNVQDVYNEGQINISSSGCSDEVELFRAVGTIEQDHTPPHTPEELSSGNMSPHARHGLRNFDGAPTALFSGTPLTEDDITRRRSCSTSRSQSSSPAPPLSPAKAGSHLPGQQKDLSFFLSRDQLPRALAPISSARVEGEEDVIPLFSSQSRQIVPTVVSEIEEDSEDTTECISKSYEIIGREKNMYMTVPASSSVETAFLLPDIPSEDEVAKQLARQGHITHGEESKPNLSSLGFNCVQGYSYTEDLQQVETVEEIIDYTNDVQPDNSQFVDVRKQNSSLPCTESSQVQPVVNVNVCAPALLGMCEEMSESLQQQIKTSYSAPTSSTPGRLSMSVVTQPSTNQNKQPVVTRSGQVLTQASLITKSSDTAKQQWYGGDRQQLLVSKGLHSDKDSQELISHLGSLKDKTKFTTEHDNQHLELSNEHIQKILNSLAMSKNLAVDNQNYAQPFTLSQMVLNLQPHLPSRKITVLSSRNGIAIARQSSEELPVQQESADQMSAEASVTNILPGRAGVPMINIASPRVHTLNPTSHVANLRSSSSYSSSGETTDPPVTTQHHYFVKEGTRMILVNKQLPEASPSIAQAPTLVAGPNSSALPSDNTDYSENVQDLPSLNLTELNSDNNLFEKKPSRSTS